MPYSPRPLDLSANIQLRQCNLDGNKLPPRARSGPRREPRTCATALPLWILRWTPNSPTRGTKKGDRKEVRTPEERTSGLSGWSFLLCSALSLSFPHPQRSPSSFPLHSYSGYYEGSACLTTPGRLPDNRLR